MNAAIIDAAGLVAVSGVFGGMAFFAFAATLLAFASAARGADALAMGCIGVVFLLARFALLPIINRNRDAGQAGDLAAKKRFDALHRASVVVNLLQMLAVLVVLVRFAVY